MSGTLRVGTRGSPLARAQANEVIAQLGRIHPDIRAEMVVVTTHGDEGYRSDLGTDLDGKRAFTKRIEEALLEDRIDVAVHSLKDVPTEPVDGLVLAAVPPRADPRDVLVASEPRALMDLPAGTRVGTSSLRRRAQLLALRPELDIVELHGNVGTRLRSLEAKDLNTVVVAAAGLHRLADDSRTKRLVAGIEDPLARKAVDVERALSAAVGGGCNVPFGALATFANGGMDLRAVVASPDGGRVVRASVRETAADGTKAVKEAARRLRDGGAREILEAMG
ncbi:MAG: hydroxymethylbilane synthase [Methanobacteriota archaeon]|nr:MAG: hydroxymethylbilane synthase [Euryarchaeota archaeon]